MTSYNISCIAEVDFQIEAESEEDAIAKIRARFDAARPLKPGKWGTDEMYGKKLPKGGTLFGIKAFKYEAWEA